MTFQILQCWIVFWRFCSFKSFSCSLNKNGCWSVVLLTECVSLRRRYQTFSCKESLTSFRIQRHPRQSSTTVSFKSQTITVFWGYGVCSDLPDSDFVHALPYVYFSSIHRMLSVHSSTIGAQLQYSYKYFFNIQTMTPVQISWTIEDNVAKWVYLWDHMAMRINVKSPPLREITTTTHICTIRSMSTPLMSQRISDCTLYEVFLNDP